MFVLLDNSSGTGGPSLMFDDPLETIAAIDPGSVGNALDRIESALGKGFCAAGFFSYELGYALEPRLAARMPGHRNVPLLWFGIFRQPRALTEHDVLALLAAGGSGAISGPIIPDWPPEAYGERFAAAHEKIACGDIYQLNLTFKVRFELRGSPLACYRDLRLRQPVAHGAFIDTDELSILSLSPEQFFARDGRKIVSRPMKGTAARGRSAEADAQARAELARDPKQRAENLMIVDLMRNDIGRMAEIGSVSVSDLFTVETFKTVHQMTSGIEARLRDGVSLRETIGALFPPGSVTGAPKIRAMELISELEATPRGVYCGAIGFLGPGPTARFNVAIRTAVIDRNGRGEMGIGSAVVADSEGRSEYDECLLKMKFLASVERDFQLIETLLYEPLGSFWLLERHLSRLRHSAEHFGFAYAEPDIRRALAHAVVEQKTARLRVRLLLSESGQVQVNASPLPEPTAGAEMRFVIAMNAIDSDDPFLAHKTTSRLRYDEDWRRCHDATGADEVVYVNEKGELTEGSRTNIFIRTTGGQMLLTPPLACGVLPGVLRAELLADGRAAEAVITRADLAAAETVYLGNSVRGLLKALLIADGWD